MLPNGNTVMILPKVISPAAIEDLIPPPFVIATSASVTMIIESAIKLPKLVSPVRTSPRVPTNSTAVCPTTSLRMIP